MMVVLWYYTVKHFSIKPQSDLFDFSPRPLFARVLASIFTRVSFFSIVFFLPPASPPFFLPSGLRNHMPALQHGATPLIPAACVAVCAPSAPSRRLPASFNKASACLLIFLETSINPGVEKTQRSSRACHVKRLQKTLKMFKKCKQTQ